MTKRGEMDHDNPECLEHGRFTTAQLSGLL